MLEMVTLKNFFERNVDNVDKKVEYFLWET